MLQCFTNLATAKGCSLHLARSPGIGQAATTQLRDRRTSTGYAVTRRTPCDHGFASSLNDWQAHPDKKQKLSRIRRGSAVEGGIAGLGRYTVNAVTATTVEALLSTVAQATAVGSLSWESKKPVTWMGRIEVTTALNDCPVGMLRIAYVTPRPDRIHVQYLVNGVPVRRLDVNDSHKDWIDVTHGFVCLM